MPNPAETIRQDLDEAEADCRQIVRGHWAVHRVVLSDSTAICNLAFTRIDIDIIIINAKERQERVLV
jgi:hypothetical protein